MLPTRPIHTGVDATGSYALTAHNNPSMVSVHRINADGTLDFARTYDVEPGGKFQWWAGIVGLPAARG